MDESKHLVHMSLSAIFSALILAVVAGLIFLGYQMWGALERQDTANERIRNYTMYSAFDNTTVRGQEVVQLMEEHSDDIFILIYEGKSNPSSNHIDTMSDCGTSPIACMIKNTNPDGYLERYTINDANKTENSNLALNAAINNLPTGSSLYDYQQDLSVVNFYNDAKSGNYNALSDAFLNPNILGKDTGNGSSFAAFKSAIVYDNDNTSDIIGVVLVKEAPGITEY